MTRSTLAGTLLRYADTWGAERVGVVVRLARRACQPDAFVKYSPDQPRDAHGRFTDAGGGSWQVSRPLSNGVVASSTMSVAQSKAVVDALHAHGIDAALAAATPEFRAGFEALQQSSPVAHRALEQRLQNTIHAMGGTYRSDYMAGHGMRAWTGAMKSPARIIEKTALEYDGDLSLINDAVRGVVTVDKASEVQHAIDSVRAHFDVIREKNRFEKPLPTGYRDYLANVRLPNGQTGEIQVHVKPLLNAKETTGHSYYEQLRTLVGNSSASQVLRQSLIAASLALYSHAWSAAGGKI